MIYRRTVLQKFPDVTHMWHFKHELGTEYPTRDAYKAHVAVNENAEREIQRGNEELQFLIDVNYHSSNAQRLV